MPRKLRVDALTAALGIAAIGATHPARAQDKLQSISHFVNPFMSTDSTEARARKVSNLVGGNSDDFELYLALPADREKRNAILQAKAPQTDPKLIAAYGDLLTMAGNMVIGFNKIGAAGYKDSQVQDLWNTVATMQLIRMSIVAPENTIFDKIPDYNGDDPSKKLIKIVANLGREGILDLLNPKEDTQEVLKLVLTDKLTTLMQMTTPEKATPDLLKKVSPDALRDVSGSTLLYRSALTLMISGTNSPDRHASAQMKDTLEQLDYNHQDEAAKIKAATLKQSDVPGESIRFDLPRRYSSITHKTQISRLAI